MPSSICIKQKDFKNHSLLTRLLELHDIPKEIFIKGKIPEVTFDEYGRATPRILTIVGSRKNTEYGKSVIVSLLASCKGEDIIIISGLAMGIDGISHKEALRNDLVTIAIPGSGLDEKVLYPGIHRLLSEEIIEKGGLLLSELEDDKAPAPWTFPQRNRIMAALSDAVLIIEAEEKSGTLITARLALELGRDIGTVPGNIFSPTAKGPHLLIKDGAYSISCATDLFDLLHLTKKEITSQDFTLSQHEQLLLDLIREPMDKDLLYTQSKLQFDEFISAFSSLEINGCIQELFGEVRKVV